MTKKEHLEDHIKLHKCFDILLADFIQDKHLEIYSDKYKGLSGVKVFDLLMWSSQQIEKLSKKGKDEKI